jgi:hypothetical protein
VVRWSAVRRRVEHGLLDRPVIHAGTEAHACRYARTSSAPLHTIEVANKRYRRDIQYTCWVPGCMQPSIDKSLRKEQILCQAGEGKSQADRYKKKCSADSWFPVSGAAHLDPTRAASALGPAATDSILPSSLFAIVHRPMDAT